MVQTTDLGKLTLKEIAGEHFLTVEASDTLAQVFDKLRDHQSAAAVFRQGEEWRVIAAEILPEVLLKGPEALQQPASALGQPLALLSLSDSLHQLQQALNQNTWVAAMGEGKPARLLHWTSWARYAARRRVAGSYQFSPEWGRQEAPVAKV